MRTRLLVALICASASLMSPGLAAGDTSASEVAGPDKSTASKPDSEKADSAKADKSEESASSTTTQAAKPLEKPPAGLAYAFATYRVYATQFEPSVPGSVEVAVPDKCVKFAALRHTATLSALKCSASYSLDRDYRLAVTRDDGQSGIVPVKEAGPWNVDDNWWAGRRADELRRMAVDLPAGRPQAQVASASGYNLVSDCKDLGGKPTGTPGGADQFGRCVRNPAGIDLSVAAAKALGFGPLENAWVNVTLLWEPVEVSITNAVTSKSLDVRDSLRTEGAPVVQGTYVGVANQHWRLRPVSENVYTMTVGHSGKLLAVRDRSTIDGATINQQVPTGATNQQWRLEAQGPASKIQGASGSFRLISVGSGMALNVAGGATGEGVPAIQSTATASASQTWELKIIEPPAPKPLVTAVASASTTTTSVATTSVATTSVATTSVGAP